MAMGALNPVTGTPDMDAPPIRLYAELTMVGPSGDPITVYQTGKGTPDDPFRYDVDKPTYTNVNKRTITIDGKSQEVNLVSPTGASGGGTGAKMTYTPQIDPIDNRQKGANGMFPLGTYSSPFAALAASDIESVFSKNPSKVDDVAGKAMKTIDASIAGAKAKGDVALAAQLESDKFALSQTTLLVKGGYTGKALDDQLNLLNTLAPDQRGYAEELNKAGINAGKVGALDFARRVNVLAAIDKSRTELRPSYTYGGKPVGVAGGGFVPTRDPNAYSTQRSQAFNPTINPYEIKVPGMPGLTDAEKALIPRVPNDTSWMNSPYGRMTVGMMGTAGQSLMSNIPSTTLAPGGVPVPPGNTYTPPKTDYKPPEPPKTDKKKDGDKPTSSLTGGTDSSTVNPSTGFVTGGPSAGPNAGTWRPYSSSGTRGRLVF
jgi:hypothetical protein